MISFLLGVVACVLAVVAGGSWWTLFAAAPFAIPGRIGPLVGTVALFVFLPFALAPAWASLLLAASGALALLALLRRVGGRMPWVALPWWFAALVVILAGSPYLPPAGVWVDSDLALRLRILLLAVIALVGGAVTYRPRYRNEPAPPGSPPVGGLGGAAPGGPGSTGGRDAKR